MLKPYSRRLLSLSLVAVILLFCLGVAQGEQPVNLLSNTSFELITETGRPEGWTEFHPWGTNALVSVDETIAHTGSRSVKIHCPNDGDRGTVGLFVEVVPGMTYQFKAWCRTEGTGQLKTDVGPVARFSLLQDKPDPKAQITLYAQGTGQNDWELVETSFTIPEGIHWVRLDLFMLFQQGTVWWDDVEFLLVEEANLLPNQSFEIITDGKARWWGKDNWGTNAQVLFDDTTAQDGSISVKIHCPSGNDRGAVNQRLMVLPGGTYRISGWFKTQGVVGGDLQDKGPLVRILFYEDEKAPNGLHPIMVTVPKVQEWTYFSREFTVPEGMVSMRMDFFMYFQQGTVWWDNVELAFLGFL